STSARTCTGECSVSECKARARRRRSATSFTRCGRPWRCAASMTSTSGRVRECKSSTRTTTPGPRSICSSPTLASSRGARSPAATTAGCSRSPEPGGAGSRVVVRGGMRAVFVMLKVEPGTLHKVAEAISDLEIVSEMYSVVGDYDLLAKVYVDSFDELAEMVNDRIQKVPHIRETKTIITFDAYDMPKPKAPD